MREKREACTMRSSLLAGARVCGAGVWGWPHGNEGEGARCASFFCTRTPAGRRAFMPQNNSTRPEPFMARPRSSTSHSGPARVPCVRLSVGYQGAPPSKTRTGGRPCDPTKKPRPHRKVARGQAGCATAPHTPRLRGTPKNACAGGPRAEQGGGDVRVACGWCGDAGRGRGKQWKEERRRRPRRRRDKGPSIDLLCGVKGVRGVESRGMFRVRARLCMM